jgi:type II secretory pathway component GspD/PulD (secretin)
MKMGREALQKKNYDLAKECGMRASAVSTRWGLFEDTPAKLLADTSKQRAEHNRSEAEHMLVDARKMYMKGELDKAAEMARKADKLHGQSSWDITDRPQKLLAEIESARIKQQKLNPTTQAAKPTTPSASPTTSGTMQAQATDNSASPSILPLSPVPTTTTATNPTKQKAMSLVAEARTYVRNDRLVEARSKCMEADGLRAEFSPEEDQPSRLLLEISGKAQTRIDAMVSQSAMLAAKDPTQAQTLLNQAKQFATAMGLSTIAIDERMAGVTKGGSPTVAALPTAFPAAQPAANSTQLGQQMLEKANLEMRNGNMEAARKLAEDVFSGPYNLRAEANSVLRSIEAASYNQKVLAANQAYEAGLGEYNAGHYSQAANIFLQIDGSLLSNDKRALMKQMEQEVSQRASAVKPAGVPTPVSVPIQSGFGPPAIVNSGMYPPPPPPIPGTGAQRVSSDSAPSGNAPPPMPSVNTPTTGGQASRASISDQIPPMPNLNTPPAGGQAGRVSISDQQPPMPNVPVPSMPPPSAPVASNPMPPVSSPNSTGADNYANQIQALQKIEFQRLRVEGLKVQREAQARFSKGETDAAVQLLTDHLGKLKEANLDPNDLGMLQRPVEYRLQSFKVMKAQKDSEIALSMRKSKQNELQAQRAADEDARHKQVSQLMKQFHTLMDEGKFKEAEMVAMKAHELEPESDAANLAMGLAKMAGRKKDADDRKNDKEQLVLDGLNDTDREGKYLDVRNPLDIDPATLARAGNRGGNGYTIGQRMRTEKEREIERKLSTPISIDFKNTSLNQVIDDLRVMTKMNMVPALEAIRDENPKALEQPISLKLDGVALKSALNILLRQARLTYVIQDDALQITTERAARGKLVQKVYSVADLVIPIDNYAIPNSSQLMKALERNTGNSVTPNGIVSGSSPYSLTNGQPAGQSSLSTQPSAGAATNPGSNVAPGAMAASTYTTLAKNTLEDVLMKLVTNTVSPQSWNDVGGPGTIDYFPIGMALVINQTPDVQEQVQELLEALRRLQDLEVAVEVRIITVAETFFERIGMDFSMNIETHNNPNTQAQLATGQFQAPGNINNFSPAGFVSGLTPAGTFTNDLNIPIKADSFQRAIPPFGGYPNTPGSNGGLSLGVAFLNEIQVFMFMEAAQGDRRTNVMQAPKLTLFNGQTSVIQVQDFQFFVTGVTVTSVNGQIVFTPNNTPFPVGQVTLTGQGASGVGINLAIQAVVTADRRFVRLNLSPSLSSLASAIVPLFPVTTIVTPILEGGFVGQPIPFTQFIQQPSFSFVNIQTTVMVPDGGTVLLGGLKSLSEGRNEYGPPILSKIPYLSRLVKNTGYGREAQSMMIMVTPRIIINSEEAERQTGELPPQP